MTRKSWRRRLATSGSLGLGVVLLACPPASPCAVGMSVPIPETDATDPTVSYQVQGRGGALVQVASGVSSPREIPMPPGAVTITAEARDPQGVRKVTLVLIPITCTTARATGETACTRSTPQTHTNADAGLAGASGCTARNISASVNVSRTLTTTRDQVEERAEVLVTGQNFGGRNTTILYKELVPRP